MKNCVDLETAIALKEAGFVPPEFDLWQMYYVDDLLSAITFLFQDGDIEYVSYGISRFNITKRADFLKKAVFAPNALEIMRQMPVGSSLENDTFKSWFSVWRNDHKKFSHHDRCPHQVMVEAFLSWKKHE
jgi:hypothetical protein